MEKKEVLNDKKVEQVKTEIKREMKKENKKIENFKEKKEKGKKRAICARVLIILIILLIVIALICIAIPRPVRVLEQMLTELKSGNFEKVEQYVDYKELINIPVFDFDEDTEKQKLLFKDLEWSVKNTIKEKDIVKVEIDIKNRNYKTIVNNYYDKFIQKLVERENISTEEMNKYLIEQLSSENIDKVTSKKIITVKKENEKWKVIIDNELKDSIYPGLSDMFKNGDVGYVNL